MAKVLTSKHPELATRSNKEGETPQFRIALSGNVEHVLLFLELAPQTVDTPNAQ